MTDTSIPEPSNGVDRSQFEGRIVHIIEDDVFLGKVLSQKVEEFKIVPRRFLNAEDALQSLKTEIPSLILLDIFLPGINGLNALEQIRQDDHTKDIPVIVISNTDEAKDRQKALDLGAMFLIKAATTPDEIIDHVFDVLAKTK